MNVGVAFQTALVLPASGGEPIAVRQEICGVLGDMLVFEQQTVFQDVEVALDARIGSGKQSRGADQCVNLFESNSHNAGTAVLLKMTFIQARQVQHRISRRHCEFFKASCGRVSLERV